MWLARDRVGSRLSLDMSSFKKITFDAHPVLLVTILGPSRALLFDGTGLISDAQVVEPASRR